MSSLAPIEKRFLEDVLQMRDGRVLDFSNNSFADCLRDTVKVDILSGKYAARGMSKANRLRTFWETEPDPVVAKVLSAMLEVIQYNDTKQGCHPDDRQYDRYRSIVARLSGKPKDDVGSESDFLQKTFRSIDLHGLPIDPPVIAILQSRIDEVERSRQAGASLSVIFLCGSILEGVLLGAALQHPKQFNESVGSPKDRDGKVRAFQDWTLCQFIDVASEIKLVGLDVKKFSHSLRDFRNYIHPYQQMASGFEPSRHTADICYQVMKACIAYVGGDDGK